MQPCCADPENREVQEEREDATVQVCLVCGRRHFEVTVDPAVIGVRVASLAPGARFDEE